MDRTPPVHTQTFPEALLKQMTPKA